MSHILYTVLITPLELMIEVIYTCSSRVFHQPGIAILAVSLAVNLLLLPLYLRADALSAAESRRQKSLEVWSKKIRAAFRSDERNMMLACYYREQHYRPAMALLGVAPLLLQIPFFIAAYHFFSHLGVLSGTSFLGISDLSAPDGLLRLSSGGSIHLLPLLMTAINCLSVYVYAKDQPLRTQLRSYALALIFLILLYASPSGLVLYWTSNNLFSLIKNIALSRRPLTDCNLSSEKKDPELRIFYSLLLIVMTIFLGGLIPAEVVNASVTEMVNVGAATTPLHYVFYALLVYGGLFLIWGNVLWMILPEKRRKICVNILLALLFCLFGDYLLFPYRGGLLTNALTFISEGEEDTILYFIRNLTVCGSCALLIVLLRKRFPKVIFCIMAVFPVISSVYFLKDVIRIDRQSREWYAKRAQEEAGLSDTSLPLSRNGHNVIIIGLDRAISSYIPFIFTEKPELLASFDGFTWYPDTASFGCVTPLAMPGLMGGYDYTPLNMNARTDSLLIAKTNEALRVMPTIFGENGYHVTVVDPPLANYQVPGDISIYDDLPYVNAFRMDGYCASPEEKAIGSALLERNMIFYTLYRTVPGVLKSLIYDDGCYLNASGYFPPSSFIEANAVLESLAERTAISDTAEDQFLLLYNNTAHEPALLSAPDYDVNNSMKGYTDPLPHTMSLGDQTIRFDDSISLSYMVAHYTINVAALDRLADYFDYLKSENVWDNTRIIVVADHGWNLGNFDQLKYAFDFPPEMLESLDPELREQMEDLVVDAEAFNPLLLVKDFGSSGFNIDYSFMTNADVPVLATDSLISEPINPYTSTPLRTDPKLQGIDIAETPNPDYTADKTGFNLDGTLLFHVHDSLFAPENWGVSIFNPQPAD